MAPCRRSIAKVVVETWASKRASRSSTRPGETGDCGAGSGTGLSREGGHWVSEPGGGESGRGATESGREHTMRAKSR